MNQFVEFFKKLHEIIFIIHKIEVALNFYLSFGNVQFGDKLELIIFYKLINLIVKKKMM